MKSKKDVQLNLAMDIGGSKIDLVLHDDAGTEVRQRIQLGEGYSPGCLSASQFSPPQVIEMICQWLQEQGIQEGGLNSIAIASAPNMDLEGKVTRWPNRPEWAGTEVVEPLSQYARNTIFWCDDGVASTLADGAHFNYQNLIHIVIGTGIGGSAIVHGRVVDTPEFGHQIVIPGGDSCVCSQNGCLQAYVSAGSLDKAIASHGESNIADWVTQASNILALFVQNISSLFGTSLVLVSGGLIKRIPYLVDQTNQILEQQRNNSDRLIRISVSPNSANAALAGAVALSGDALTKEKMDDLRCSVRMRQL